MVKNEIYGYIYKIINLVNGKIYIGQTTKKNPFSRFTEHISRCREVDNMNISKAIKKYGKENFNFIVIDEAFSRKELDIREGLWIRLFNSTNPSLGYNIQSFSDKGEYIISETTRIKLRNAWKKPENILISKENGKKRRGVPYLGTTSKYVGVAKRGEDKWVSYFSKNGKRVHLGTFDTEYDAALMRDIEEFKISGNKSLLNFPENIEKYKNNQIIVLKNNPKKSPSNIRGVTYSKYHKKWIAKIVGFKAKYFKTMEEAENQVISWRS